LEIMMSNGTNGSTATATVSPEASASQAGQPATQVTQSADTGTVQAITPASAVQPGNATATVSPVAGAPATNGQPAVTSHADAASGAESTAVAGVARAFAQKLKAKGIVTDPAILDQISALSFDQGAIVSHATAEQAAVIRQQEDRIRQLEQLERQRSAETKSRQISDWINEAIQSSGGLAGKTQTELSAMADVLHKSITLEAGDDPTPENIRALVEAKRVAMPSMFRPAGQIDTAFGGFQAMTPRVPIPSAQATMTAEQVKAQEARYRRELM
jgi:hypothetical protein